LREHNQTEIRFRERLGRFVWFKSGPDPMNIRSGGNADPLGETENGLGPEIGANRVSHDMDEIFGAEKPFLNKDISPNSQAITAIVARDEAARTGRSGVARKLALPGVLITGALAVSIFLAQHGISNLSSRQNAKPLPLPAPLLAQVDRVPALIQSQPVSTAPISLASKNATRNSATVGSRARSRPVNHKHWTHHFAMRPVIRAPKNAHSSGSIPIGTRSPGYSYDPHDHHYPFVVYGAPYVSYYRESASSDRQRLEDRRRWEERQERLRIWEPRRWRGEHRRSRNDDDDDDDD
jgi:hypothetical protein